MALNLIPKKGGLAASTNNPKNVRELYRVTDIILDESHEKYRVPNDIYRVFFTEEKRVGQINSAIPKNIHHFIVPQIGSLIEVDFFPDGGGYYRDMGGDDSQRENYYNSAISIHNSVSCNALPTPTPKQPTSTENKKLAEQNGPTDKFAFEKEFKSFDRELARKKLDSYLRDLGYTSGITDPRAPKYKLFQNENNEFIFRLDKSRDNRRIERKLGKYYKENPNARPPKVTEGSVNLIGTNKQGIFLTNTTPESETPWSSGVTDAEDDGNPSVGDPAIILRVGDPLIWNGNLDTPNINTDVSSIYMFSNQKLVNFIPSCDNVETRNSTYVEIKDPFDTISEPPEPEEVNNEYEIEDDLFVETITSGTDYTNSIPLEDIPIQGIEREVFTQDEAFAALLESQEADILTFEVIEQDGDYDIDYAPPPPGTNLTPIPTGSAPSLDARYTTDPTTVSIGGVPAFDFRGTDISSLRGKGFILPHAHGNTTHPSRANSPYNRPGDKTKTEFGGYRGLYTDGRTHGNPPRLGYHRYHWGIDTVATRGVNRNLLAIGDGKVVFKSPRAFNLTNGASQAYGNIIAIQLNAAPDYVAFYAHCAPGSTTLNVGDNVRKGDAIAIMGNSGSSRGTHLHFEIIKDETGRQWSDVSSIIYIKPYKKDASTLFPELIAGNRW